MTDRQGTRGTLSQLRRVHIRDSTVTVIDHQFGVTWRASGTDVDFTRGQFGGVEAKALSSLALGDQAATLSLTASLAPNTGVTSVHARLTQVVPAALARSAPGLAMLAAVDAPIGLAASAELDAGLRPVNAGLSARLGAGGLRIGDATVPVGGAELDLTATKDTITIGQMRLWTPARDGWRLPG